MSELDNESSGLKRFWCSVRYIFDDMMTQYRNTFMGNVGFEELKRYSRQGTEFGREIVNILNERAQLEQYYAKGLRRLGQRISKATSLLLGSGLTNAWKTVGVEMEKEAELHNETGQFLIEDCIKPLSMLTEKQVKPRRMMEQQVEGTGKTWTDRYNEHQKVKRRLHTIIRENESMIDQIHGPRPKTDKDQQKLVAKQLKQEEIVFRADAEYYNSLIQLERSRQDFESASFECCDAFEDMDGDRFRELSRVLRKYADNLYEIPSRMKTMCRTIDDATENLSATKEVSVVSEKLRGAPYTAEQLLCDYYQENFSCQMSIDRRRASVSKLLERYICDSQKERQHRDGLVRLEKVSNDDLTTKLEQSSALLMFFDVIRYKLGCTLASLDGNAQPQHPLANNIEHHTDKQGIIYSMLRLQPGEADEKMKNSNKSRSSKTKSTKSHAPTPHSSSSSSHTKKKSSDSDRRHSSDRRNGTAPSSAKKHSSNPIESRNSSSGESKKHSFSSEESSKYTIPPATLTPPDSHTSVDADELCRCVAIYDYAATREDELSIHEGDVIKVFEKGADDWWRGEVNGKVGLFPANYVDVEISV
ncbi:unnamed protein product [Clavelina lepadiformis]|uniref:Nostrin n=1 Tax=Clavelina lepadiformis TaxID=159417 RepID=A0ABP0EY50_CLALP